VRWEADKATQTHIKHLILYVLGEGMKFAIASQEGDLGSELRLVAHSLDNDCAESLPL
jgi:hypothetical protein